MDTGKRTAALAAVVVAVALAATGTWAYTNFVQQETNEVDGTSTPGVRLHDDFANVGSAELNKVENKDVYVENYGDHPQFVRIKLSEYVQLDTEKVLPANAQVGDPSTWYVHTPVGTAAGVHEDPDGDTFHDWWTWTLGSSTTKFYKKTTNKDDTSPLVDQDPTGSYSAVSDTVGQTLPSAVLTMAEWLALGDADARKAYQGWVWDTDGWAYWVGPLKAGDATGLLLDAVTMTVVPEAKDFHYKINVALQAATSEDIAKFALADNGGMTKNAADMLNLYQPKAPEVVLGMAAKTVDATSGTALSIDLNDYITDANYGDTLTFEVVSTTAVNTTAPALDADGHTLKYTPVAGDVGANHVIVVRAHDAAGAYSPSVTITLNVAAA
jgi:hypothetical protein